MIPGLPDLSVILAGMLGLVSVVAGVFVKLWQGQKERAAEERRRAENEVSKRLAERASRAAAEIAQQRAEDKVREVEKKVADGKLDHFENQ